MYQIQTIAILGRGEQDFVLFRQAMAKIRGCSFVYVTAQILLDEGGVSSSKSAFYFEKFDKIVISEKVYRIFQNMYASEPWMSWIFEHPKQCMILQDIDIYMGSNTHLFSRKGSDESMYELRNSVLKQIFPDAETLILSNDGHSILKDVDVLLEWIDNSKAFTMKTVDEFQHYLDHHPNVCNVLFIETDLLQSNIEPFVRIPHDVCTFLVANVDRIVYTDPISVVLHKTPFSLHMFQGKGCYIGFTSPPPHSTASRFGSGSKTKTKTKRSNSFLHMAGLSPYKQTDIVLHSFIYLRQHTNFQGVLHVSCYDNVIDIVQHILQFYDISWLHSDPRIQDEFGFRPTSFPGLFISYERFDDHVKDRLVGSTEFLIQPSVIEGYGHVIHEAHYYDCIIITQQTPYTINTMVHNVNCILIPFDTYTHNLILRTGKTSINATPPNALRFYYCNVNDVIQALLLAMDMRTDSTRMQQMLEWSRYLHLQQRKTCFYNLSKFFSTTLNANAIVDESRLDMDMEMPDHMSDGMSFLQHTKYDLKLSFRLRTIRTAIDIMCNHKSGHYNILEVGCGYSQEKPDYVRHGLTHIWDDLIKVYGGSVYSIDDDEKNVLNAILHTSVQTIPMKEFCAKTLSSIPLPLIDLLYISCASKMPTTQPTQEYYAQQRLQQCKILYDRIPNHCVIVVDEAPIHARDCDVHSGTYVFQYLLGEGCKLLEHMYQAVFLKMEKP
jgi:hypothetical protein